MVKVATLDIIRNLIDELELQYGGIPFAIALPNSVGDDDIPLTLFLAAPWIESRGKKQSLSIIINRLRDLTQHNDYLAVSRVSLVSIDDPLVKTFYPVSVTKSKMAFEGCNFNGTFIEKAYVFENCHAKREADYASHANLSTRHTA